MRKTKFKYFFVSPNYQEGKNDESIIALTEEGLLLLDKLLDKTQKESTK